MKETRKLPVIAIKLAQQCGSKTTALYQGIYDRALDSRSLLTSAKKGMFVTAIKKPHQPRLVGRVPNSNCRYEKTCSLEQTRN